MQLSSEWRYAVGCIYLCKLFISSTTLYDVLGFLNKKNSALKVCYLIIEMPWRLETKHVYKACSDLLQG